MFTAPWSHAPAFLHVMAITFFTFSGPARSQREASIRPFDAKANSTDILGSPDQALQMGGLADGGGQRASSANLLQFLLAQFLFCSPGRLLVVLAHGFLLLWFRQINFKSVTFA